MGLFAVPADAQLFGFFRGRGNCSDGSCSQKTVTYEGMIQTAQFDQRINTELHSTSDAAIFELLKILDPKAGETIYDLRCGDGKILITAAQKYGTRGLGVELNPATAVNAKHRVKVAGLSDRITILTGDAANQDLSGADYVVMHLYPETIRRILPRLKTLKPEVTVISYQHDIPDLETSVRARQIDGSEHRFYLYPRRKREKRNPPLFSLR